MREYAHLLLMECACGMHVHMCVYVHISAALRRHITGRVQRRIPCGRLTLTTQALFHHHPPHTTTPPLSFSLFLSHSFSPSLHPSLPPSLPHSLPPPSLALALALSLALALALALSLSLSLSFSFSLSSRFFSLFRSRHLNSLPILLICYPCSRPAINRLEFDQFAHARTCRVLASLKWFSRLPRQACSPTPQIPFPHPFPESPFLSSPFPSKNKRLASQHVHKRAHIQKYKRWRVHIHAPSRTLINTPTLASARAC